MIATNVITRVEDAVEANAASVVVQVCLEEMGSNNIFQIMEDEYITCYEHPLQISTEKSVMSQLDFEDTETSYSNVIIRKEGNENNIITGQKKRRRNFFSIFTFLIEALSFKRRKTITKVDAKVKNSTPLRNDIIEIELNEIEKKSSNNGFLLSPPPCCLIK
ncbi:hypothetical protein ABK040_010416 [Willaertia magna]